MKVWIILSLLCLIIPLYTAESTRTKLAFAAYYSDHMVLQRGPKKANIWGYADLEYAGKAVQVTLTGIGYTKTFTGTVKIGPIHGRGVWSVLLDPMYSKNYKHAFKITATLMTEKISISDVLFGDVWVCSGQSNMGFSVIQMFNNTMELNNAGRYKDIRVFSVKRANSKTPRYELGGVDLQWALPNKTNIGHPPFTYLSAVCWVYGRRIYEYLQYPIGLVESVIGGTPVESWSTPEGLKSCNVKDAPGFDYKSPGFENEMSPYKFSPTFEGPVNPWIQKNVLFNAMIHPLLNMTIYGAIWYQGESNAEKPFTYNCTFPRMISDWRLYFHRGSNGQTDPVFPFGFVQLAAITGKNPLFDYPAIRWHQTADVGYVPNTLMQNTFMATAVDLPDATSPWGDFHPRVKEPIGSRLANAGLSIAYGIGKYPVTGPEPTKYEADPVQNTLNIWYKNEILVRSKTGFDVCCTKKNTTCPWDAVGGKGWNHVTIINFKEADNMITLDCKVCQGMQIKGVRYLWANNPCKLMDCAIYDGISALPQTPFYKADIKTTIRSL